MAMFGSPVALMQRIQQFVQQRQEHANAISRIDKTLDHVSAALGNGAIRHGRAKKSTSLRVAAEAPPVKRSKRRRRKFATSAETSILLFVKEHKNPTTQEIKKHWAGEGRGGTADNTLSKLVKERKLKRTPLHGQRGSTYGSI